MSKYELQIDPILDKPLESDDPFFQLEEGASPSAPIILEAPVSYEWQYLPLNTGSALRLALEDVNIPIERIVDECFGKFWFFGILSVAEVTGIDSEPQLKQLAAKLATSPYITGMKICIFIDFRSY